MFRYCVDHGHLCLMRLKEGINLAKSCKGDAISTLPGDPKKGTGNVRIRVIGVPLCTGEMKYLATNLFDEAFTKDMFLELYFMRWPIEGKYLELKEYLQIEEFNGATSISIQQEFYINLLISNLSALLKADADEAIEQNRRPTNKHRY